MKKNQPFARLAWVVPVFFLSAIHAEETAVVADNRINVRGQASLAGEVITQLQKGEKVTILEEITLTKPKTDEPAKWYRIRMPANTPVWVFAPYVDPATKTINVPRLNLRAGPGENFSVLGRLEKGDTIKDIRTVEEWMEIETPPTAYAFVAAELLTKPTTNAPPSLLTKSAPTPAAPKTEPPPPLVAPRTIRTNEPPAAVADSTSPAPKTDTVSSPAAANVGAPAVRTNLPPAIEPPPVQPVTKPPPREVTSQSPAPTPSTSETLPKRIVRREGIVRSTKSIQAPTYFELVSLETRKTINYLHTEDVGLSLKDFRGKKIIVTGEESIDPRWPKTPLIEVETLEPAP